MSRLKRVFIIFVLGLIITQSVSKLWVLGSFYANREYITNNLCVNRFDAIPVCKGKCYLEKTLKENEQKERQLPDFKQKEIQLFYQKSFFTSLADQQTEIQLSFISLEQKKYHYDFLASVFHPPQVA